MMHKDVKYMSATCWSTLRWEWDLKIYACKAVRVAAEATRPRSLGLSMSVDVGLSVLRLSVLAPSHAAAELVLLQCNHTFESTFRLQGNQPVFENTFRFLNPITLSILPTF
jgi:hypothetical protein